MSEPIGVGDFVECIRIETDVPHGYVLGGVYVVSECGSGRGIPWLNCNRMKTPRECGLPFRGWAIECFRPIHRPSSSTLIETLLKQPAPTKKVSA